MKTGIRKPSINKSIKAKTTGAITRQIKASANPLYGKKGMGMVNDPKKTTYNMVYSKTTMSVSDIASRKSTKSRKYGDSISDYELAFADKVEKNVYNHSPKTYKVCSVLMKILSIIIALIIGLPCLCIGMIPVGLIAVAAAFGCFWLGRGMKKTAQEMPESLNNE